MNKDLSLYVKKYNLLSKETCNHIIQNIECNNWQQHAYYDETLDKTVSINDQNELDISFTENEYVLDIVMKKIWQSFHLYCNDLKFPWFNQISDFSIVRFNRYENSKLMSEHCDHIKTLFPGNVSGVPILTSLGMLNDNFSGGQLVMFQNEIIHMNPGDILVFPSNFLYPHRVNPVTEGIRYSFVSWAW